MMDDEEFSILKGEIIIEIDGGETHQSEMIFRTASGMTLILYHEQDCCESVFIEDIVGDLDDIMNSPVLLAEEVNSERPPIDPETNYYDESYTWTFYKLSTIKGSITIRWLGTSNGYYSESVDITVTR